MRTYTVFIILNTISFLVNAQTSFGIKGGLNLSDIVEKDFDYDLTIAAGYHAGAFASFPLREKLHLKTEVLYSIKGAQYPSTNNIGKSRYVTIVNDDATDYDWNRGGGLLRDNFIRAERSRTGINDSHGFKAYYYGIGTLNK